MDRQELDHLLGTFCHLDRGRCYSFDDGFSLLCHRCTAIYSTFLLVCLLAFFFSWRGQILRFRSKMAVGTMAVLFLAICGVQVLIQEWAPGLAGGHWGRIASGCFVAIGLFQLSRLSGDDFPLPAGSWYFSLLLVACMVIHVVLLRDSFTYNSLTTVVGLIWLYHQINLQVLDPWIQGRGVVIRHGLAVVCILLEWSALYAINVMKIHV